ncbi:MAG: hypothetical protein K7J46_01835 [Bryobacter sp.]|jgi:hypothetical protein|nr:hypothetical protein [Bryobacter sp. CoA8 C33]
MDILGERKFVEIPGNRTHELPPLLVRSTPVKRLDKMVSMAEDILSSEDLLSTLPLLDPRIELEFERRRMDLALNLVDQYQTFMHTWAWGDSILEWIKQCETTFESRPDLRPLLKADVWPHAGRKSFVVLLEDKARHLTINPEGALGLRLTFRQPPPISCFSDQFLFYLNGSLAQSAFRTWAGMNPDPVSDLPPERFRFDVVTM